MTPDIEAIVARHQQVGHACVYDGVLSAFHGAPAEDRPCHARILADALAAAEARLEQHEQAWNLNNDEMVRIVKQRDAAEAERDEAREAWAPMLNEMSRRREKAEADADALRELLRVALDVLTMYQDVPPIDSVRGKRLDAAIADIRAALAPHDAARAVIGWEPKPIRGLDHPSPRATPDPALAALMVENIRKRHERPHGCNDEERCDIGVLLDINADLARKAERWDQIRDQIREMAEKGLSHTRMGRAVHVIVASLEEREW